MTLITGELPSGTPRPVRVNKDGHVHIVPGDNASIDAFGRLRTSSPYTVFDITHDYGLQPLFEESVLTGAGTVAHLPNESAVRMRCTTASGDKVVRQTKRYYRYQPGKSQHVSFTFVMGAAKTNVRKRVGYFDVQNGVFLEQTATGPAVVLRSYTTGTAVDTRIVQADWNVDAMDGKGPSGATLDLSKAQILVIDLQWLGVGRVRVGFNINGITHYVHEFLHANETTTVYMTTATLPVRYEIENTGAAASQTDMLQICSEISSEGGVTERAQVFSVSNEAALVTVSSTLIPLLSIRLDTVFPAGGSITNRTAIVPEGIHVFSEDNPCHWGVFYNPTLTGASWTNFNTTHSGVQYDVSATAISGGVELDSGYVTGGGVASGETSAAIRSDLALTLDVAGTTSDILTVAAIRVGVSNTDVAAEVSWRELY